MKVKSSWLQEYIIEKIPSPEEIAETLSLKAFGVEGIEGTGEDAVIDIDILPNRASDCLSHRGIAREISALFGLTFKERDIRKMKDGDMSFSVSVKNPDLCNRYIALPISGLKIGPSPEWLKERLEAIGERSINNIVDITNFVMFDTGQPLHAFDKDKMKGDEIIVRLSQKGEKLFTLDDKEVLLDGSELVISDSESPLALAGIKGGKKAEVDNNTSFIVLESAIFDPVSVRITSRRLNILTESSKRFENQPSPFLSITAVLLARDLLAEYAVSQKSKTNVFFGKPIDFYSKEVSSSDISMPFSDFEDILGVEIQKKEIHDILGRIGCETASKGETLIVKPPFYRADLSIPEEIAEEVGRIHGYENLDSKLPETPKNKVAINNKFLTKATIVHTLQKHGFSEVYTYSIRDKGEIELANPLTYDKRFLRDELSSDLEKVLEFNERNAELLGEDSIRVFEISNIFKKKNEKTSLVIAVKNAGKKGKPKEKEIIEETLKAISFKVGGEIEKFGSFTSKLVWEGDVGKFINSLSEFPKDFPEFSQLNKDIKEEFKPISPYPFVLRDIAVFVPADVEAGDALDVIVKNGSDLLVKSRLFDTYEKTFESGEKKISYAFRLVFLSQEKTLSDSEVNKVMEVMTGKLNSKKGWQVR